VKVYTVGAARAGLAPYPVQDMFGGTVYRPMRVDIDEDALQKIAATTGARYFRATDTKPARRLRGDRPQREDAVRGAGVRRLPRALSLARLAGARLVLVEVGLAETVLRKLP
jgi:Ca-activated chloride channel family protein